MQRVAESEIVPACGHGAGVLPCDVHRSASSVAASMTTTHMSAAVATHVAAAVAGTSMADRTRVYRTTCRGDAMPRRAMSNTGVAGTCGVPRTQRREADARDAVAGTRKKGRGERCDATMTKVGVASEQMPAADKHTADGDQCAGHRPPLIVFR